MTQQDALRKNFEAHIRSRYPRISLEKVTYDDDYCHSTVSIAWRTWIAAHESALAEQDDEAVGYVFASEGAILQEYGICFDKERAQTIFNHVFQKFDTIDGVTTEIPGTTDGAELIGLHRRPAPNIYNEHDIDVAIGVVEWDKLNLFETAEMVKQIVMRFVGSQVTMEVKRLSEDEVELLVGQYGEAHHLNGTNQYVRAIIGDNVDDFANALMDKMTGGGK